MEEKIKYPDWAALNRYKTKNKSIPAPTEGERRIVFFGDSITQAWKTLKPEFFASKSYINRGINGQTTSQMLLRFRPDVIELQPEIVVILAGTNDIAGNTGPATLETILGNIISMCELAKVNKIKPILCSVLPANDYPWTANKEPADKIITLNTMIENYAQANDIAYAAYYSTMVDEQKGLKSIYSEDGVHPNQKGYAVMEPIIEAVIHQLK